MIKFNKKPTLKDEMKKKKKKAKAKAKTKKKCLLKKVMSLI
jgi:hypothetical protein